MSASWDFQWKFCQTTRSSWTALNSIGIQDPTILQNFRSSEFILKSVGGGAYRARADRQITYSALTGLSDPVDPYHLRTSWKKFYKRSLVEVTPTTHIRFAVMVAASFFSTLFFALSVAAHPVERSGSFPRLSFTKHIIDEIFNIVEQDLLRVEFIIKGLDIDLHGIFGFNSPAVNRAVTYVASVGVGDPPTYCKWLQHLVAPN